MRDRWRERFLRARAAWRAWRLRHGFIPIDPFSGESTVARLRDVIRR